MEHLAGATENYVVRQIAEKLDIDCAKLVGRFRKGGVKFKDENQTLRQIRRKYLLRLPR